MNSQDPDKDTQKKTGTTKNKNYVLKNKKAAPTKQKNPNQINAHHQIQHHTKRLVLTYTNPDPDQVKPYE